ncbi:hypothetical protein ANN_11390 [Periplaneta americana]|uniref:Reverse transcriptase n=1 Tax=Periplaneta americana TaxID=6978 RepID=A0ABQ8T4V7_PERAM|nr:hypothetical protein ANN_11390 [Periplaneta americana]
MVVPIRSLPGRSTCATQCRHCSEYETLPHVFGSCPQGEVLRIKRHNIIRSMITDALRSKNLEVHEEVHCIADGGRNRRIDIIAINSNKQTAEIIDPTIRFEISATEPSEVNEEKKKIYEPTIQYHQRNTKLKNHSYRALIRSERHHSENLCKVEGKIQDEERYSRCHRHQQNNMFCSDISFQLRVVTAFLTGHVSVKKHLNLMGILQGNLDCRFCGKETETAQHIICSCVALTRRRYLIFGKDSLEPNDFEPSSIPGLYTLIKRYMGSRETLRRYATRRSETNTNGTKFDSSELEGGGWRQWEAREMHSYHCEPQCARYLASELGEGDNAGEMSPRSSTESYPAFSQIGLKENPGKTSTREINLGSGAESYTEFALNGLRENSGKKPQPEESSVLDATGYYRIYLSRYKLQTWKEVRQECPLSPTLSNISLENLLKNCFQNIGRMIVGGRIITCIRFDDDMALLVEEEIILRDMVQKLNDSCEHVGLYEAETWTLRRSEEKRIEAFEMWIWRRMERVKWTERITNEAVLERVGEERMMLKLIRKRKRIWLGHWLRRNCLLKNALEVMMNGRRARVRRRYQMIDDIKILYGSNDETKRNAENRKDWRKLSLQWKNCPWAEH